MLLIKYSRRMAVYKFSFKYFHDFSRSTFRLADILEAHRTAISENRHDFIDSCTMMSHYGHVMNTIIGPMENIKITTPTDFFIFRAMVQVHENQQIFGF